MARPKTKRRRKALLSAAQRAIRERYAEFDLELADIAADVGCSPRQLQRVFTELGSGSFREYLLRARVENAYRLLSRRKNRLTVQRAARAVGFREASGLRQAFKRFYRQVPSEIQPPPPDYSELWKQIERQSS